MPIQKVSWVFLQKKRHQIGDLLGAETAMLRQNRRAPDLTFPDSLACTICAKKPESDFAKPKL
jgi:hypothetical protein